MMVILLTGGCNSLDEAMHFEMPTLDTTTANVNAIWPKAPDRARYVYIGDLTGESNYRTELARKTSGLKRVVRLITGQARTTDVVTLRRPQTGTIDDLGRILVTDVGRAAIFVFDPAAGRLELWDGSNMNVPFKSPIGIASHLGITYVTDSELGHIVLFNVSGQFIGTMGGESLQRPTGITLDKIREELYVADTVTHDVKTFDLDGNLLRTIGTRGVGDAQFNAPTFLWFDNDKLYVSDTLNARVQILTRHGEALQQVGHRGLYVGNLTRPKGVTTDSEGRLYVTESYYDHLLIFDAEGRFLLPIGASGKGAGQFFQPAGVWSDDQNRIYVADMFNGRIAVFQHLDDSEDLP